MIKIYFKSCKFFEILKGFQVLVEREWIEFGHKFSDRCGTGVDSDDPNERCPVFLQWIDCVHQVLHQYPIAFQFNQAYLVSRVCFQEIFVKFQ